MSDSDFRSSLGNGDNVKPTIDIQPHQPRYLSPQQLLLSIHRNGTLFNSTMMRTARALFVLLCFLRGASAFLPTAPPPRTPALSLWPMTKVTDKPCANVKEKSWRRRLVSILPSMLRPTQNKTKRRALASLLVAASFAFSQPVAALSSKKDVAPCVKQREPSDGNIPQKEGQRKSTSLDGDPKLASIPVSSTKEGFWTKRKVIMVAAGGGTVLGLSLVPPVKDEDDDTDEETNPSASEIQVQPLPSFISKEAFRELEELFGGGGENAKTSEALAPEQFVKSSAPSIEEDVRVIYDPSAEMAIAETSAKPKSKGIKAVKKVTPLVEEEVLSANVAPSNTYVQDSKDETIAEDQNKTKLPELDPDDAAAAAKDEEAARKGILEKRLRQTDQEKKRIARDADELDNVVAVEHSKNSVSNAGDPGNELYTESIADAAALAKKEEATRRAMLEERLKEEAKRLKEQTRLRKAKEDEAARRALLEERLKQESIMAETKQDEQLGNEEFDDVDSTPTPNKMLRSVDEIPEAGLSNPLNKEEPPSVEPVFEASPEGVEPMTGRKRKYRRQPLSPDEEAELQKKYSSLPLKERAYRILVDLGMIDSSPE